jgi:membrane associated rhomboid family serine protease
MLIPIGTDIRIHRAPVGNWLLIGLNIAIYLLTRSAGEAEATRTQFTLNAAIPGLSQYITYQFLHADIGHLLGNMLFLWIFGHAVCARMGSVAYMLFYLAGGVFAGIVFTAYNANPLLGASGAIAAVTTAFLVLFPRVHITMLLWIFFYLTTFQIPAMLVIVFKIILWDTIIAPSFARGMESNVAFSAHLGGYAFGFAVAMLMLAVRALPRNQFDMLALWDRWRRRQGLGRAIRTSSPLLARPITAEEMDSRPLEPLQLSPVERLREEILDRLAERDTEGAAELYLRLTELDDTQVLPLAHQLEIANHLAQTHRKREAARAYESFLAAYPTAPDAPQVRLLAGLIYRRYLRDFERAAAHLRAALDALTLEAQRSLALEELRLAESSLSRPDEHA